jgi:hypothetical protein
VRKRERGGEREREREKESENAMGSRDISQSSLGPILLLQNRPHCMLVCGRGKFYLLPIGSV